MCSRYGEDKLHKQKHGQQDKGSLLPFHLEQVRLDLEQ